jgi:hypothetical protein
MVHDVGDVHVARSIDGDSLGPVELPSTGASAPPVGEQGSRAAELLDAVVACVSNVEIAGLVDSEAVRDR